MTGADLGEQDGALFRYLNASKRSVLGELDQNLDREGEAGAESEALIASADLLIEDLRPARTIARRCSSGTPAW